MLKDEARRMRGWMLKDLQQTLAYLPGHLIWLRDVLEHRLPEFHHWFSAETEFSIAQFKLPLIVRYVTPREFVREAKVLENGTILVRSGANPEDWKEIG